MSIIYKYRIYCKTDEKFEYVWDTTPPTICPIDGGHSVESASVLAIDKNFLRTITADHSPFYYNSFYTLVDTSLGDVDINFPYTELSKGVMIFIQRAQGSAGNITLNAFAGDTVESGATYNIATNDFSTCIFSASGNDWQLIGIEQEKVLEPENKVREYPLLSENSGSILVSDGLEYIPLTIDGDGKTLVSTNNELSWSTPNAKRFRNFMFATSNFSSRHDPMGCAIVKNATKNTTRKSLPTAFIFEGTNAGDSISKMRVLIYDVEGNIGSNPVSAKVSLMTGITEIASVSIDNTVTPIQLLSNDGNLLETTTINNLPTTSKSIRIQLELTLGNTTANYYVGISQIILEL